MEPSSDQWGPGASPPAQAAWPGPAACHRPVQEVLVGGCGGAEIGLLYLGTSDKLEKSPAPCREPEGGRARPAWAAVGSWGAWPRLVLCRGPRCSFPGTDSRFCSSLFPSAQQALRPRGRGVLGWGLPSSGRAPAFPPWSRSEGCGRGCPGCPGRRPLVYSPPRPPSVGWRHPPETRAAWGLGRPCIAFPTPTRPLPPPGPQPGPQPGPPPNTAIWNTMTWHSLSWGLGPQRWRGLGRGRVRERQMCGD